MAIKIGKVGDIGTQLASKGDRLLAAIARGAEELTSGKGWPDGVIDLMEDLGLITGVSRVWIFQTIELGPDYIIQDYPFEWADAPEHVQLDMPGFNMFRTNFTNEEYVQMIQSRLRGEWQSVVTAELHDGRLKNNQADQKILSMLTIPIMVEGQWWGTLGFDDCKREYKWSDVEIALLRTASYLISNAIIRDRLSAKTRQFQILQGITESSSWELDMKKNHFWCSPEILGERGGVTQSVHMTLRETLELIHPDDRKELIRAYRRYKKGAESNFRQDVRVITACGGYVWVEVIGALSRDQNGQPETLAGIAVEILKRKMEEETLRRQAKEDPLTGAGNRAAFDRELSRLLETSIDRDGRFALLLADLDNFKAVNDEWGHSVGDMALQHFVAICRNNLRHSDILARIGGEEFALLLPDADEDAARIIGDRIRSEFCTSPLIVDGQKIPITASLGCAGFPCKVNVESRSQFFKLADFALYAAKRGGRNRLVVTGDLDMTCAI